MKSFSVKLKYLHSFRQTYNCKPISNILNWINGHYLNFEIKANRPTILLAFRKNYLLMESNSSLISLFTKFTY